MLIKMTKSNIKNKIMRRVYFIWFVREVLPYLALEAMVLAGFIYFLGQQVYVARVLEYSTFVLSTNMAHPLVFLSFALKLFLRTRIGVQFSIIGSLTMAFFLFRNIISSTFQLALVKETNSNVLTF